MPIRHWKWLRIHDRETPLDQLIRLLNERLKKLADMLGGALGAGDEINAAEAHFWNNGSLLVTGQSDWLFVPFDFTITVAEIVTDQPGILEVAVYASSYPNWDTFTKISGTAPVTAAGTKKAHSPLTGWTTTFTGGTYLRWDVINTPGLITKATVTLLLSVPNSVLVSESGDLVSGSAGGVLSGTFPNPGFAEDMATQVELNAVAAAKADITYVDAKVAGLSWKQAVRAATTVAGTLASSFANGSAIDGVTLATGNRILVKNQATASENGVYIVAASGAPTRATDADAGAELVNATMYVSEGTANADTQWTCTTNAPITMGVTSLAFAQLSTGAALTVKDEGSTLSTAVTSIDVVGAGATATNVGGAVTLTIPGGGTTPAEVLISEQTPSGTGTVSFTSIPATWRDLRIVVRGRGSVAATSTNVRLQFNADAGANYDWEIRESSTTTTTANNNLAQTSLHVGYLAGSTAPANSADACEARIYDYRGTTFQKVISAHAAAKTTTAAGGLFRTSFAGFWRGTAAITQIDVSLASGNFSAGSVVSLYGIL